MRGPGAGPVRWSGDGRLVSSGGRIAGGPSLPTQELDWAPRGETAAYVTHAGGVMLWRPRGSVRIRRDGWGATGLAWSSDGRLAIGRRGGSLWAWDGRRVRRRAVLGARFGEPIPAAWSGDRIVWWDYPMSESLAADGVFLFADRARIGATLMGADFVVRCGAALAIVDGGDRYATHGKRIVLAGRDVSRDASRSWISPACSADGSTLVAAAGRNWVEDRFGHEHRAIWQLLPRRRQLTHPPAGWTDEDPQLLRDGSILFVRTRLVPFRRRGQWMVTVRASLERLHEGRRTRITSMSSTAPEVSALGNVNYYGHYGWSRLIAARP
jgi:hypothetical protein